jgi:hypothetical protein
VSGRTLTDSEQSRSRAVAVIDVEMARRNWGTPKAAVNTHLRIAPAAQSYQVIGVVGSFNGYWSQTNLPTVYLFSRAQPRLTPTSRPER